MTEWVEDMTGIEFLEELGSQFRQEAETQGMTRMEGTMMFIKDQLTSCDCKALIPVLVDWMVEEAKREENIGRCDKSRAASAGRVLIRDVTHGRLN